MRCASPPNGLAAAMRVPVADLSKRALELLPADGAEHGSLVAETVGWLNRAGRYGEAEELAVAGLSEAASPKQEAEIRLRRAAHTRHSTQRRVEENRRERCSWATSARSPGHGTWPGWPTT